MVRRPKETKTDTSSASAEKPVRPAIIMPETPEYKTMFERLYGRPGPPVDTDLPFTFPSTKKEKSVAAKTGSIDRPANSNEIGTKVILFRDHTLLFPELWLKVHLIGPPEDTKGFPHLFVRAECSMAENLADADLAVFTGGPDVDPAYYGEKPHSSTYVDDERDYADIAAYMTCLEDGIPMVGVCRGAQFLAVMAGFKLWQDINNHHSDHQMWDNRKKIMLERVSSVHHQAVIAGPGMEVIGTTGLSTDRWKNNLQSQIANKDHPFMDVEAYYIRETGAFGVQGHPEYKTYNNYAKWFFETIYECFNVNPDFRWRAKGEPSEGKLRMRLDLLEERDLISRMKPPGEEKFVLGPNAAQALTGEK